MKSALPKVLHPVAGRPMVEYPLRAAMEAEVSQVCVVLGPEGDEVRKVIESRLPNAPFSFALQPEQRGTGDAVRCALSSLQGVNGGVIIVYGDVPLVTKEALRALINLSRTSGKPLTMLTGNLDHPAGYGRILRSADGHVMSIREDRDCNEHDRGIHEVNPGFYAMSMDFLRSNIERLSAANAQQELYLTELVQIAAGSKGVAAMRWPMSELTGVNTRWELSMANCSMHQRLLREHAERGVGYRDPTTTYVDADVSIGEDTWLEPGVILRGRTRIGARVRIDTGAVLTDVQVGDDTYIKPYTVAERTVLSNHVVVGPFTHMRPGTVLDQGAHLGNFVETKNTRMGVGAKANHLAYLGDGEIGARVNVGAGTIFCNYDGFQKHVTVLEDGCFIGSDSQLIAPVRVGSGAYIGTGTTVNQDVPAEALALSRPQMVIKENYAARLRERLKKNDE